MPSNLIVNLCLNQCLLYVKKLGLYSDCKDGLTFNY